MSMTIDPGATTSEAAIRAALRAELDPALSALHSFVDRRIAELSAELHASVEIADMGETRMTSELARIQEQIAQLVAVPAAATHRNRGVCPAGARWHDEQHCRNADQRGKPGQRQEPAAHIVVIARYLHPAIEPLPGLAAIAAGVEGNDVLAVGHAQDHPPPMRIGRAAALDPVLVGDEALLVKA